MKRGVVLVVIAIIALSSFITLPLAHGSESRINIVATLQIYSYFAKQIGGERVNVTYIVPQGEDIHSYSLKYEDIEKLNRANLVILASSEFFAIDRNIKEKVSGKEILDFKDYNVTLYPLGNMERNVHGYWLYPQNAINISLAIKKKLEEMDPQHRSYYENNFLKFKNEVESTLQRIDVIKDETGIKGRNVLLVIPGVFYVAKTMGLNVKGTILEGPHQFISESGLKEIRKEIENGNISCIINAVGLQSSKAGQIAIELSRETGVKIAYIDIFSTANYTALLLKDASILAGTNYIYSYGMEKCDYGFYILTIILVVSIAIILAYITYKYRKELLK